MQNSSILLIIAGLILLGSAFWFDPEIWMYPPFGILPFPYSLITLFGISLTLIGFGIKKIVQR